MGTIIHPTAILDAAADLGEDVEVGPFVTIGPNVKIGDRTCLLPNCHVLANTTVGADSVVAVSAVLGGFPQDVKYNREDTGLAVGDRARIGEFATLNRGTAAGGGTTVVGSDCMIMAYAHVGHDCRLGDHVVVANASHLSGHTHVGDRVVISGGCFVHQFVTIGTLAFLAPTSTLRRDAPPYMIVEAVPAKKTRFVLNQIGLARNGVPADSIARLRKVCHVLFHRKTTATLADALETAASGLSAPDPYVDNLIDQLRATLAGRKLRRLEGERH